METITIEKVIKFDNLIDSIENVEVNNDLRYDLYDDETHASGVIKVNGCVNTLMGKKDFDDDVEVEIFTPYNKVINKEQFKINVKDYSYMVNQSNLIIYLILEIEGIVDKNEEDNVIIEQSIEADHNEIVHSMNEVNAINNVEEERKIEEEPSNTLNDEIKLTAKEVNTADNMNKTWATDLFKLSENYSVFKVFHVD